MNKEDIYKILVPSGDDFAKSNPEMYWGTATPSCSDYVSGMRTHLELENCDDIKVLEFNNWNCLGSSLDWIKSGLINGKTVSDLFEVPIGFSDSEGAIGMRMEYYIRVYTDHVALWRNNKLNQIKGNIDDGLIEFLKENYTDYVTLAFKVD